MMRVLRDHLQWTKNNHTSELTPQLYSKLHNIALGNPPITHMSLKLSKMLMFYSIGSYGPILSGVSL